MANISLQNSSHDYSFLQYYGTNTTVLFIFTSWPSQVPSAIKLNLKDHCSYSNKEEQTDQLPEQPTPFLWRSQQPLELLQLFVVIGRVTYAIVCVCVYVWERKTMKKERIGHISYNYWTNIFSESHTNLESAIKNPMTPHFRYKNKLCSS